MVWYNPGSWLKNNAQQRQSILTEKLLELQLRSFPVSNLPSKVFIDTEEPLPAHGYEYSEFLPAMLDKYSGALNGFYSQQNFIELFSCLPELFAPIHEIASRVADANWQLCKEWNDEVDYKDADFNRLFTQPNPIQDFRTFVYQSVCYEILTGKQFFYLNRPDSLPQDEPASILSWYNLHTPSVVIDTKKAVDIYSMTEIKDLILQYKIYQNNRWRIFQPEKVVPILYTSLKQALDLNCTHPPIAGADKAIRNLLPVYEARGIIYIKRGALGLLVNKGKDQSGTIPLTEEEKLDLAKLDSDNYGITYGKQPIKHTTANVDFVRTAMSIKELEPFEETLQDAVSIYATLRVPRHFVPSKDTSTFANADADTKAFYTNVIVPWAQKYALAWTNIMGWKNKRRYIRANFDHIDVLQENKKEKADVDKIKTETAILLYEKGVITKNQRNAMLDQESVQDGETFATDPQNADPLATRLGVGGLQALQAILVNTTIAEDAKKNILVILFGIAEEDAAKIVQQNEASITSENPSTQTAGSAD